MKNLLWYLIAGTKGGETRGKIIELLEKYRFLKRFGLNLGKSR